MEAQRDRRTPRDEGKLAASLAHEINNPLDSLLSLLYLMRSELNLTERGRRYLTLAEEEVQRVSQIAHSALERNREAAAPKDANVPRLLGSVVDFYYPRFESRGIAVKTRYCLGGELPVFAGPLRQVFSNLLLNAADAMPKGGRLYARVSRAHEWTGEAGQERYGLRVTVADSGCGIPEENLRMVLKPFFTTKGSHGNGLGLSLVKEVVQAHGGSLRVRSSTAAGHSGSVFTIFLPAA